MIHFSSCTVQSKEMNLYNQSPWIICAKKITTYYTYTRFEKANKFSSFGNDTQLCYLCTSGRKKLDKTMDTPLILRLSYL